MKLKKLLNLDFGDGTPTADAGLLEQEMPSTKDEIKALAEDVTGCRSMIEELKVSLDGQVDLKAQLKKLDDKLTWLLDRKLMNVCRQIEAASAIQNYINFGVMPLSYHGWPISPDVALFLIQQLESESYDLVVEFGSGTSTVLIATICDRVFQRLEEGTYGQGQDKTDGRPPFRILSFEHDQEYHDKTRDLLKSSDKAAYVSLVHAPLTEVNVGGGVYSYYDCDEALEAVTREFKGKKLKVLALVDGPPGTTGTHARYPALIKLLDGLKLSKLDLLLDDSKRDEEKEVIDKWVDHLNFLSVNHSEKSLDFEKGAELISVWLDN